MGGKSKSSAPAQQTITNTTELPEFAKTFLTDASRRATALTKPQDQFFPGSTVAPLSNETEQALQLQTMLAQQGSQTLPGAQNQLLSTLGGEFFGNVPGSGLLEQTAAGAFLPGGEQQGQFFNSLEGILNRQAPQISSTFEQFGRTNSGLADVARAQAASDAFAGLIGQERGRQVDAAKTLGDQFSNERLRQIQALGLQPGLEQQRFADANALQQVGDIRNRFAQANLNDEVNRFNFNQDIERQQALQLLGLGGVVSGAGGTSTQTGPGQPQAQGSPILGALGGGLSGFQLGASLGAGFGPIGAIGGALLGGLFS